MGENLGQNLTLGLAGVNDPPPFRLLGGQAQESFTHFAVELQRLTIEAVFGLDSSQTDRGIDVEQDREVGF